MTNEKGAQEIKMNKSFVHYSLLYVGCYIATLVIGVAFVFSLTVFAPTFATSVLDNGGGQAVTIATIAVPPMLFGHWFYRHEGRGMYAGEGWLMAILFMVLGLVVSFALVSIYFAFVGLSFFELFPFLEGETTLLVNLLGIYSTIIMLLNRLGLWASIRSSIRRGEAAAAKTDREG